MQWTLLCSKGIKRNKTPTGSGRWNIKIDKKHLEDRGGRNSDKLGSIIDFYNKIHQKCLCRIQGFEKCSLNDMHLLKNEGPLAEQYAHKDYEPKSV